MDLSQIKSSTVILIIAGLGLLIGLMLPSSTQITLFFTAKIVAVVGAVFAFFGL